MRKIIKIFLLAFLILNAPISISNAQAGVLAKIFKALLKSCPGLPVFDFSTIPPKIPQVFSNVKDFALMEVEKRVNQQLDGIKSGELKLSVSPIKTTDFAGLTNSDGPFNGTNRGTAEFMLPSKHSPDFDVEDAQSVAKAVEELFLVEKGEEKPVMQAHESNRKRFYENNILEVHSRIQQLEDKLEAEIFPIVDNLKDVSVSDKDINEVFRNNFALRQSVNQLLMILQETQALKLQLESARKIYKEVKPKKDPLLSFNIYGDYITTASFSGNTTIINAKSTQETKTTKDDGSQEGVSADISDGMPPIVFAKDEVEELTKLVAVQESLDRARDAHNVIYELQQYENNIKTNLKIIKEHYQAINAVKTSDSCVLGYLSQFSSNPTSTWLGNSYHAEAVNDYDKRAGLSKLSLNRYDAVKATMANEEADPDSLEEMSDEELDSSIASSSGGLENEKVKSVNELRGETTTMDKKTSPKTMSEAELKKSLEEGEKLVLAGWNIGKQTSLDIFKNGSDNKKKLWTDQKSLYNVYFDYVYEKMRKYVFAHSGYSPSSEINSYKNAVASTKYISSVANAHQEMLNKVKKKLQTLKLKPVDFSQALFNVPLPGPTQPPVLPHPREIFYFDASDAQDLDKSGGKLESHPVYAGLPEIWKDILLLKSGILKYGNFKTAIDDGPELYNKIVSKGGNSAIVKRLNDSARSIDIPLPEIPKGFATVYNDLSPNINLSTSNIEASELGMLLRGTKVRGEWLSEDEDAEDITFNRNLIGTWLALTENERQAREARELAEQSIEKIEQDLQDYLTKVGYTVSSSLDITEDGYFQEIRDTLINHKLKELADANNAITAINVRNDEIIMERLAKIRKYLDALEKDKDVYIQMTEETANAEDLDEQIREGEANKAAIDKYAKDSEDDQRTLKVYCPIY